MAVPTGSAWLVNLSLSRQEGITDKSRPLHRREEEFREAKFHLSVTLCSEYHIMTRVETTSRKGASGPRIWSHLALLRFGGLGLSSYAV